MFATKPKLFSIGTIVFLTLVWTNQPVKLITSIGLNLVKQVNLLNLCLSHLFCPIYLSNQ